MPIATCRRHRWTTSSSCISLFHFLFSMMSLSSLCCCVCWPFSWHVCSELDGWLQGVRVRDVRRRRVSGQSAGFSPSRARWQEDRPQSCIPSPSSPQGSILRRFFSLYPIALMHYPSICSQNRRGAGLSSGLFPASLSFFFSSSLFQLPFMTSNIFTIISDGHQDEEDLCWRIIGSVDGRRCQRLLWTIWTGKMMFSFLTPYKEKGAREFCRQKLW